jgi:tetraprenyl-beta-curcumene synthase
MRTSMVAPASNGCVHPLPRKLHPPPLDLAPPFRASRSAARVELAGAFAQTVICYLARVLPHVERELVHWRDRAAAIPNPALRAAARDALAKRGNLEGAALFATLAPPADRRAALRALLAFQTAYSYLDALSELPSERPVENSDQLHQALLVALCPGAPHADYYAQNPERDDGGYLVAVLDACRDALAALPSYAPLAPTAREAAARIVDFQALNLSEPQGGHSALERWAREITQVGSGLAWWETAAAAGSSLAVHALIAAAARTGLDAGDARAIERAYHPWIGALHSLLDSLVDRREDHARLTLSLLDHYGPPTAMVERLAALALRARHAADELPDRCAQRVIVTAMCSYYLSAPECRAADARMVAGALSGALGLPLSAAIALFRAKRLLHTLARDSYL